MQKTQRNILIAAVVGVAVVGGVLAYGGGDLFQGLLKGKKEIVADSGLMSEQNVGPQVKVKPKPVDCSEGLIYDSTTDDFQNLYTIISNDIGADAKVSCAYDFEAFTGEVPGQRSITYVCGKESLRLFTREGGYNTIICSHPIADGMTWANLTLGDNYLHEDMIYRSANAYAGYVTHNDTISEYYLVYRHPADWIQ